MGNEHDTEACALQALFQPGNTLEIQVVGRLIQQEQVGFKCDGAGQSDPLPGSARQTFYEGRLLQTEFADKRLGAGGASPVLILFKVSANGL